jgi:hypothetical protein
VFLFELLQLKDLGYADIRFGSSRAMAETKQFGPHVTIIQYFAPASLTRFSFPGDKDLKNMPVAFVPMSPDCQQMFRQSYFD